MKKKKASKARKTPKKPFSVNLMIDGNKFAKLAFQSIHDTCEDFLAVSGITGETMSQVQKVNLLEAGSLKRAKRKSVREILRQQLELLAKESKHALPANCELSKNSFAMAKISNELLRRKCLALMFAVALGYFIKCLAVHGK